ncbi:MAG: hypothetical protein ACOX3W_03950 [Christensenellaceae bacterium]
MKDLLLEYNPYLPYIKNDAEAPASFFISFYQYTLRDFLGKITVGAAADFVLLDPSTLDLKQTYIRGHLEYEA